MIFQDKNPHQQKDEQCECKMDIEQFVLEVIFDKMMRMTSAKESLIGLRVRLYSARNLFFSIISAV